MTTENKRPTHGERIPFVTSGGQIASAQVDGIEVWYTNKDGDLVITSAGIRWLHDLLEYKRGKEGAQE